MSQTIPAVNGTITSRGEPFPRTFHWASAMDAATAQAVVIRIVRKLWSSSFFSEARAPISGMALAISAEKCVTESVSAPNRTVLININTVQTNL